MPKKTLEYSPTVPPGPIPQELEMMDAEVRTQGFLVGKAIQEASLSLRYKYPNWAAFWDQLYYMLDQQFGGES